jgi:putative transposase
MKDRYFWKNMWRDTQRYVADCDLCHRTNHWRGKPMGLLQPLSIAKGRWQRIGIDFITDLPTSENGHDCIETFVHHMTKRAHWRACKKTIDAPAFTRMAIDHIVRLHGVPQEVVSDREVRFTADYWRQVTTILQTKLLMSTVFHTETDCLSENLNKTVVCYLRGFATHDQGNWDNYLPFAEYAYNSSIHRSTKQTPFELDLGYNPPLPLDLIADLQRPQAKESAKTLQGREFVERLQRILEVSRDELRDAQDQQMAEANKSRSPIDPAITAGAKVFLDTKDLPVTYANVNPTRRKLVHRYIGPYEILRIRGNAVELDLPNDMMIHDTVNVSRLKIDRTDNSRIAWRPPPPPVRTSRAGTSYVVESIANHRSRSDGTGWEYEVKWEGWDEKDNTWEPEENMAKAKETVKQYWKELGGRPKTKRKVMIKQA